MAAGIDWILFMFLFLAVGMSAAAFRGKGGWIGLGLLYFGLPETVWGRSPGKGLMGLRVATASGARAGVGGVALRTVAFWAVPALASAVLTRLAVLRVVSEQGGLTPFLYAALLIPARRRNGFVGLHDLASGTRAIVVARRRAGPAPVPERPPVSSLAVDAIPGASGPYRTTGVVSSTPQESVYTARDDRLHRDVWLHHFADPGLWGPVAEVSAVRLRSFLVATGRTGRLMCLGRLRRARWRRVRALGR